MGAAVCKVYLILPSFIVISLAKTLNRDREERRRSRGDGSD